MVNEVRSVVAHNSAGAVSLAFSPDGRTIYTGGGDCLARIWNVSDGQNAEAEIANDADERITSIAAAEDFWITASEDNNVRKYAGASNHIQDGYITSGNAIPIRCVAIDPKGTRVAITSDDLDIKIIEVEDTTNLQLLAGHKKGVRKATWHPDGTILTTSGQDGRIIVWDLSEDIGKLLKTIDGIIPTVDVDSASFANDASIIWHPSGRQFYVATKTNEIAIVSRESWSKTTTLSSDDLSGEITALAISPNGSYLACSCRNGIYIWSLSSRKILFKHTENFGQQVCQLAWSPTDNLLAWVDTDGSLYQWEKPIAASHPGPVDEGKEKEREKRREKGLLDNEAADDFDDLDDQWMIDDLDGAAKITEDDGERARGEFAREIVAVSKAQPPFQPGATEMRNNRRCYYAFNSLGVIEITDQDTHHIVNVEFHDRSTYNSHHFSDQTRFTMAALGERGIAYAKKSESTSNPQALVSYKPYSAWGSAGEWQVSLPLGEEPIVIAAGGTPTRRSYKHRSADEMAEPEGNGNVVVATTSGYLRFFTGSGIQRYVWAVGGDVVTLVAGREWVFVVHRDGGTSLDGCQNLKYSLIALDTFELVQEGRLPLIKGRTLSWIGITEQGAPAIYDSTGILSVLDRFRRPGQARWVPILDTKTLARRQGKDESYWPVGVTEDKFLCLILKGREEAPGFPRQIVQELELQMPLLSLDDPQGVAEEKLMRESILLGWMRDALSESEVTTEEIGQKEVELDREMIKLLPIAIKADNLQKAHDHVRALHHVGSIDKALQLAEYFRMFGLGEKIKAWKALREEIDREDEELEERRAWRRGQRPIGPSAELLVGQLLTKANGNMKPEVFSAGTAFPRRSLANAVPKYEKSAFTRTTATNGFGSAMTTFKSSNYNDQESTFGDTDETMGHPRSTSPPQSETKRKRDPNDVEDGSDLPGRSASKRLRTSNDDNAAIQESQMSTISVATTVNPPAPAVNPFARKAGPNSAKPNPFARITSGTKSIVKSNTFFDKVDAAEGNIKKDGGVKKGLGAGAKQKQTTLFGIAAPANTEKKVKAKKKADTANEDTQPAAPPMDSTAENAVEETQVVESPLEETQVIPESQLMEDDDDEEPIDWPESPAREVLVA